MDKLKQYIMGSKEDWEQFLNYLTSTQGFTCKTEIGYCREYGLVKYEVKEGKTIPSIAIYACDISCSLIEVNFYNGGILTQEECIEYINSLMREFMKLIGNQCEILETVKKKFVFKNYKRWEEFKSFLVDEGYSLFAYKADNGVSLDTMIEFLIEKEVPDSISATIFNNSLVHVYYSGCKDMGGIIKGSALKLIYKYISSLSDKLRDDVIEVDCGIEEF